MLYGGVGVSRGKSWSNGVEEYLGAQRTHCFLTRAGDFSLLIIGTIRPVCADWIPEASTSSLPLPIRAPRLSGSHCFSSPPPFHPSELLTFPASSTWQELVWKSKRSNSCWGWQAHTQGQARTNCVIQEPTRTLITFPENGTINGSSILE